MPRKKAGRPPAGEYADKREVMNFRIRRDTKRLLQEAARASGRSLSQETEHQLRRALVEMRAGPTYDLMNLIGRALDLLRSLKDQNATWTSDPYLFTQAVQAAITALELFRPQQPLPADLFECGGPRQGQFAIFSTLRDVQLADPSVPFGRLSPYQRALVMAKHALGPFIDNASIWGMTGPEARQQHERSRKIRNELIPLTRREEKGDLTPEETARLWELRAALEAVANEPFEPGGSKL